MLRILNENGLEQAMVAVDYQAALAKGDIDTANLIAEDLAKEDETKKNSELILRGYAAPKGVKVTDEMLRILNENGLEQAMVAVDYQAALAKGDIDTANLIAEDLAKEDETKKNSE